ncbi:hypothetical protein HMSSN139_58560 [Paenibacillus sp. HMSSN-139]|nr:hypothetical protein HMSSN139_58560 [Paenibacillus sp. HMSSN-139]
MYVDILNTGGATAAGLKKAIWKDDNIQRLKNVMITKVVVEKGRAVGAIGFEMEEYRPISIAASSVILATGGLTEVYERNSASANMTGDGFVLAAEAGAEVRDMEMVQFFPIAHLFPPLVGIDPIMWDPFRYKLGGRLLNGLKEEFMNKYNGEVAGKYTAARDQRRWRFPRGGSRPRHAARRGLSRLHDGAGGQAEGSVWPGDRYFAESGRRFD